MNTTPDFFDVARGAPITLDEYIAHLTRLRDQLGGQALVQKWQPSLGRYHAPIPEVAYPTMRALGGRKPLVLPQFWSKQDPEEHKGPPVVRV